MLHNGLERIESRSTLAASMDNRNPIALNTSENFSSECCTMSKPVSHRNTFWVLMTFVRSFDKIMITAGALYDADTVWTLHPTQQKKN